MPNKPLVKHRRNKKNKNKNNKHSYNMTELRPKSRTMLITNLTTTKHNYCKHTVDAPHEE